MFQILCCRWFWCRLHQQFLAGTVQTGPASFAHHQRRALHGRRHQDGRGQKLPTDAAVVFHLVILHVLDFSTHSHLSSYQSSQAIGAKSIDLEWVQVHPTGLVKPDDADAKIKFFGCRGAKYHCNVARVTWSWSCATNPHWSCVRPCAG